MSTYGQLPQPLRSHRRAAHTQRQRLGLAVAIVSALFGAARLHRARPI